MNAKEQLRKQRDTFHQVVTALVLRHGTAELTATELAKAKARAKCVAVKSNGKGGVVLELLGEQPKPAAAKADAAPEVCGIERDRPHIVHEETCARSNPDSDRPCDCAIRKMVLGE